MNKIWNELSEESKKAIISNYNAYINECNSGVVSVYNDIFGDENLNPKPEINIWEDVVKTGYDIKNSFAIFKDGSGDDCIFYDGLKTSNKIINKAIATFKIAKLIELGYGGMITNEEWNSAGTKYTIDCIYCLESNSMGLSISSVTSHKCFLAFHTKKQRDRFLEYNESLCKDYYMI